jgi:ATP-dependent Clp endopeptidase proteolytic subunit ClpP
MSDKTEELLEEELEESPPPQPPPELRVLGLFGEVSEKKAEEVIYALMLLAHEGDEDIDMCISSTGGAAIDMFAIYDVMRGIKGSVDIGTVGLGKIMSAAVLLLAAGTKGKRKIGKYCRVMIHSVISGTHGSLHDLDNEMREVRYTQDQYIEVLCNETNLTEEQIREMFSKNVNVYLTAEEAVEYGIADEVI